MFRSFPNSERSLHSLLNLIKDLIADGLLFFRLLFRSRTARSAEVLFLRKQLAFYEERQVQPRRLNDSARFSLILWSRLCNWKEGHRRTSSQNWRTFVRNHAQSIVACDFLVVVTARFRTLYVFLLMEVGTRRIVHCNVTAHPPAAWTLQQLREAIPSDHFLPFPDP